MRRFLSDVLSASEKAAHLARACRKEKDLFQLLIQEKSGGEKNSKFSHDFKTLADVLIQETVRHDLGQIYPTLANNIKGEESNKFTNTLGETISVSVKDTPEQTAKLLNQVLDNHQVAAELLSKQVHTACSLPESVRLDLESKVPADETIMDVNELGIWIDPIDSTNNYIRGTVREEEYSVKGDSELTSKGLQVVTVLIGVYNMKTGCPVIGVVNQPFANYDKETQTWQGQVYWGVSFGERKICSASLTTPIVERPSATPKIVVSHTSEKCGPMLALEKAYTLIPAAGAGYKILCVARGFVDLYATTKSSTYKWDSCAGHALLSSMGGGCLDFKAAIAEETRERPQLDLELKYHEARACAEGGIEQWSNAGGVLAFRTQEDLKKLLDLLKNTDDNKA